MDKILKEDLEVALTEFGEEGLSAQFDHGDLLKKLMLKRTLSENEVVTETLTLDQVGASAQYQKHVIRQTLTPEESTELIQSAIKMISQQIDYAVVCDFCGNEHTADNKVIAGDTNAICASCLREARKALDLLQKV